jgi:hypothetical protein
MAIAKQVASLAGNYRNNTWTFLSSSFFLLTGPHMTDKQNTLFFLSLKNRNYSFKLLIETEDQILPEMEERNKFLNDLLTIRSRSDLVLHTLNLLTICF